jgi:plastocyanin
MGKRVRSIVGLLVGVAAAVSVACYGHGILSGEGIVSSQRTMSVTDNGFSPSSLTILLGDTVTFSWFGNNTNKHQVDVQGVPSSTSPSQIAGSFKVAFTTLGTFTVVDLQKPVNTATITVLSH